MTPPRFDDDAPTVASPGAPTPAPARLVAVAAARAGAGAAAALVLGLAVGRLPGADLATSGLLLASAALHVAWTPAARRAGLTPSADAWVVDLPVQTALWVALVPDVGVAPALAGWACAAALTVGRTAAQALYRAERSDGARLAARPPGPAPWRTAVAALTRADRALFARAFGTPVDAAPLEYRLAWSDRYSVRVLAPVGLAVQAAALAALVPTGAVAAYPWVLAGLGAWALAGQAIRVLRFRAYLRRAAAAVGAPPARASGCEPAEDAA